MKVGMAFSGGGARGIAHIGLIKAFEEKGISIEISAGSSAGALVAVLDAAGYKADEMFDFVKQTTLSKFFSLRLPSAGLVKTTFLEEQLLRMIPHDRFEQLNKPVKVAITNLTKGQVEIIESGSIIDAVIPSCSIPIIFPPYLRNELLYADGGLMMNLPAKVLRNDCQLLLGSNLIPYAEIPNKELTSIKGIGTRAFELVIHQNSEADVAACDVVIQHYGLRNYTLFDIAKADEIFQIGYQCALEKIDVILAHLNQ